MIKIPLTNSKTLEHKHLTGLKPIVEQNIISERKNAGNQDFQHFLDYLKDNLDILLCGKKSDLEKVIDTVERKYFISEKKLSKILNKRRRGIRKKQELKTYLTRFSQETCLSIHLPPKEYSTVSEFKSDVDNLSTDKWKDYDKVLKKIFDYEKFTKAKKGWNPYDVVSLAEVSVCPYCNRSFVTTVKTKDKKTRPVLDHFYAKSLYPYLALSLYNLIPSCYVCNSSFKGDIDLYKDEAIYPYEEEFLNLAVFKTDFINTSDNYKYLLGLSDKFKISFEIKTQDKELERKVKKSIETFVLEDTYNTHRDIVRDLIRSGIVNNESRIDEIYKEFKHIFNSRDEVKQSLFLNYITEENLGKRPLSKLTQDICNELGLVNMTNKQ